MIVHAGDSGVLRATATRPTASPRTSAVGGFGPTVKTFDIERAVHDFLITLVFDKLFDRFPNLRVASVENGSDFLRDLFHKFASIAHKMPGYFTEDPAETFRRNVWINPFWEDDVHEVVELMGADRVIFGSDWPHIEGMPDRPTTCRSCASFDAPTVRKILPRQHARPDRACGVPDRSRHGGAASPLRLGVPGGLRGGDRLGGDVLALRHDVAGDPLAFGDDVGGHVLGLAGRSSRLVGQRPDAALASARRRSRR